MTTTDTGTAITDKIRDVGEDLARSFRTVLEAVPGRPTRPNQLALALGLNRDISSRVLSATSKADPMEVAHVIPGPEPLRNVLRAAEDKAVDAALIADARSAVERFDELIRVETGTRSALDAVISASIPSAREKFELASKYSIFKGMSQLKGVQAESWLGTAVLTPAASAADRLDLTWITAGLGVQRMRPDVTIQFSYRSLGGDSDETGGRASTIDMSDLCVNPPAALAAHEAGEVLHYTLPPGPVGPLHVCDIIAVDHHPAAMRRYARAAPNHRSSLFVEPAFPVATLVFDTLLHKDAFPGADPELVIYDTGTKGIANVNDRSRDLDRMILHERVEVLDRGLDRVHCTEVPTYSAMLDRLASHFAWDPRDYRGYRCRLQYPVYGWQIAMAFEPPAASYL